MRPIASHLRCCGEKWVVKLFVRPKWATVSILLSHHQWISVSFGNLAIVSVLLQKIIKAVFLSTAYFASWNTVGSTACVLY